MDIRETEIGGCQFLGQGGQAVHCVRKSGLSLRQLAIPRVTQSQIKLRLPDERALRELLHQRVKGAYRQLQDVGCCRRISSGGSCRNYAYPRFALTQPELAQRQPRQVRQSGVGILDEEPLQRLRCLRDIILSEG